jgi:hypothetical protein
MITDGGIGGGLRNVTLDRVSIHDVYIAPNSPAHVSCFGIFGGWNVTITNSHFYNCTTFDIFVTFADSGPETRISKHVTLENNVFEDTIGSGIPPDDICCAYYNVVFRAGEATADGAVVRHNTFEGTLAISSETNWETAPRVTGNVFEADCVAGVVFRHNVMPRPCSATDKTAPLNAITAGFKDPDQHDFRLIGGPAIDAGDPLDFPPTDADGRARPAGGAPDAGAYEFGAR